MDSVSTYSLLLIFYMLLGTVSGTSGAISENRKAGRYRLPAFQTVPELLGLVAYVYVILGMGAMRGGTPIHSYIPVILMWWAGNRFGKMILPGDWQMAGLHCAFFCTALTIYHYGL